MEPDYDVLVIGSGFGGSVTALRLTEKGYRVGVLEAGRRFADEEFAEDLLEPPQIPVGAAAGLLRHPADPPAAQRDDPGRRRGGRRFTELRQHALCAAGAVLRRPAVGAHHRLARRVDAPLRAGQAHARGRHQPDVHRRRPDHERGRRRYGRRRHLRAHPGRGVLRPGRHQDAGQARARPVLRRRGPGAHRLHRVRRVHDGMPLRRQEHVGEELPRASRNPLGRKCIR